MNVPANRRLPLDTIRNAIADALWAAVSAPDLPAACVRLGLAPGEASAAWSSKRKYVRERLLVYKGTELLQLAQSVLDEYEAPGLQDLLSELTTHADHRVTDLTRREVLKALDTVPLFGDYPLYDGLAVLNPDWSKPSAFDFRIWSLRDEIEQHYVRNPDYGNAQVLELCGVLTCSQERFFDLIAKVLDPVVRRGAEQAKLAGVLSEILNADGFEVAVVGTESRHPLYAVRRLHAGVAGSPKNLIFAAVDAKPDLYFTDAINNDVAIRNASDALIYERLLPDTGLSWQAMVQWWQAREHLSSVDEARRRLYRRLLLSVKASGSPGEFALFDTFYRTFGMRLGHKLPALVPQVYLHYDPRTMQQRGRNPVLLRQRMDLLLLLDHHVRVVIEVDGRHHYSDGDLASPSKYAVLAAEDRRLRLAGYELYRFGAAEFPDADFAGDRFTIGPTSRQVAATFFETLLDKHHVLSLGVNDSDEPVRGL